MGTRVLWLGFAAVLLTLFAAVSVWTWLRHWATEPLPAENQTVFEFRAGETSGRLVERLEAAAVVECGRCLRWLIASEGVARRLQAGEYALDPGATPQELLAMLVAGEVVQHKFTIIAGTTYRELLATLAADNRLDRDSMDTLHTDPNTALDLELPFVEGAFLPDTYYFRRGDRLEDVLMRAHRAMMSKLNSTWQGRTPDSALANSAELLILASIIEKETGLETDRANISQVFNLRLQKKMRLQTDPTVIYALGEEFDGDLRRRDLRVDSPFNTYRYHGLPPTPIAMPSSAALQAAAHPATGDFLYFVAKGDGASQFSRTLDEHNAAVRRYQLRR